MYRGRGQKKLENLVQRKNSANNNNPKPSFLKEHSSKIEQKMAYLKEKISEKKRNGKEEKKGQVNADLVAFLGRIGMSQYLGKMEENGIDSYDILKQVKQAELEEIGIVKGHALKIVVNVKKEEEKAKKKSIAQSKSKIESTLDESAIRKCGSEKKIQQKGFPEIYQLQTESIPLQIKKKQFCLYCFSRSELNFCSQNCQNLYHGMFKKYENNLEKAQQTFMVKKEPQQQKQEELSDNQQFMQSFDFLFSPQLQDFAVDEYEKIKEIMKP